MRTTLFLFVLLLCRPLLWAQANGFTQLDWNVLRIDSLLPVYTEVVPLPSDYQLYDYEVQLEYPQYAPLSAAEVQVVQRSDSTLREVPVVYSSVGVQRRQGLLEYHFVPLVCRGNAYYRLTSCKISLHRTLKPVSPRRVAAVASSSSSRYASSSVLSTGRWVKISVPSDGVYQLTRSALSSMGFTRPDNVRLYGYGGHVQNEVIDADNDFDDLEEVPLYKTSAGWLFYANGLVRWTPPSTAVSGARHRTNPYARAAYYFLTEADSPGTFPTEPSSTRSVVRTVTAVPAYALHEKDEFAWYTGGRHLFESYNYINGNSQTYTLPTVDAVAEEGATLVVSFTASNDVPIKVTPTVNGIAQSAFTVKANADYWMAMSTTQTYRLATLNSGSAGTVVKLTTTAGYNGRLDYIELAYTRRLALTESYMPFSYASTGTSRFSLTASENRRPSVWRLGRRGEPAVEIQGTRSGSTYSVVVDDPTARYVALDLNAAYPSPTVVGVVANQDLHSITEIPDMVIIVPASGALVAQARRLAQAHEDLDGMKVLVVRADQIYNEFSSGTPDATAYRRFLKMLYDRAVTVDEAPRYLLLFGDAAWDNRMLSSAWRNTRPEDFLLCYESDDSFSETYCYVMEDYFGLLDDGEGSRLTGDKVDIGVGRFPVRSEEEARILVDKTLDYMAGAHAGLWKNIVCILGDDGDKNEHLRMANEVAGVVERYNPELEVRKVMWDAYPRVSGITGSTYPVVKQKIYQQMDEGALMMNYTGHGITYCLSAEQVLRIEDFDAFSSLRMPLWVTAACDVMPFDTQTANIGETAVLNAKGAAVAFYGTARTVYANYNLDMNKNFCRYVFGTDAAGQRHRLGDAVRLAKNNVVSVTNKLHYALLGDPALIIGAPVNRVVLDSINGQALDGQSELPLLKAGSLVRFSGHVADGAGQPVDGFTGVLSARLFDSESTVTCLNQAATTASDTAFVFRSRDKVLFSGNDSIRNGRFSFRFAMPVDISYSNEGGRVVFYAVSDDKQYEANGYNEQFRIGGSSDELAGDTEGPAIMAYLNREDFVYGGPVNTTPYFVAFLEDESGVNTTGNGVGHNLELCIDDNPSTTYDLNEYYLNEFGDFRRGSVAFSIPALPAGEHTLRFRAWDVLNNYSTVQLAFRVDPTLRPRLASLTVTNNPAREQTTFLFNYDRPGSTCTFRIEVFDLSGRLLWEHTEQGASAGTTYAIPWNLTTGAGVPLQTGVYLYRAGLSCDGSKESTETQKLVISRNKPASGGVIQ